MDELARNKIINEVLMRMRGEQEKEEVANCISRAMRECGYKQENIQRVIERVHSQFNRNKM
ncbi:hypothetical protein SAMN04488137_0822 [Fictibacillus solisalsi]|uniref:Uncharacterized protein n=1 Tax=Fictibacillus solisalsi TaxID=459525 RepID=A0A1G9UB25_9BACL|nr:hypothetical protein [Fictibacillus solisalsi]SDM57170.1 hypothetical protein SAMN04488137_0822 [Fictibacillus solisalsi]